MKIKYPKIKKSLFNFKTFRSPDRGSLIDNLYYIYHPDFSRSEFFNCREVFNFENRESKAIQQNTDFIESLNPINDFKEVKKTYANLSELLSKFESQENYDITESELKGIKLPSKDVLIRIWDELLTQIITKQSDVVRQFLIQLIKIIYFLKNRDKIKGFSKALNNKNWSMVASIYNGEKWEIYNPDYAKNIESYYSNKPWEK